MKAKARLVALFSYSNRSGRTGTATTRHPHPARRWGLALPADSFALDGSGVRSRPLLRPAVWLGFLGLAVVASVLLFAAAIAHAAYPAGTPLPVGAGKLVTSVAVNQASKDVYAASGGTAPNLEGAGEVKRFIFGGGEETCAGYPEHPYGIGINPTTGDVSIIDAGTFSITTFAAGCGAQTNTFNVGLNPNNFLPQPAVNSTGKIYYPRNVNSGKVEVFEPDGTPVGEVIEGLSRPNAVTLDSAGNRYVVQPRENGTNESQAVSFEGSPTGGTFLLTFAGETKTIAYSSTPATLEANIKAGLESLPLIGTNNIFLEGESVNFIGALANTDVPQMICDGSSLTGGTTPSCSVSTNSEGSAGSEGFLFKYPPVGSGPGEETLLETFYTGEITSAVVDAATGNVFIGVGYGGTGYPGKGFHIEKFNSAGVKLADFGRGAFTSGPQESSARVFNQLAVNQTDGTVYATDSGAEKVKVFKSEVRPKFLLKVQKTGSGAVQGTVTSDIGEINCGVGSACEHEYEEQEFVTLTEQPGSASFVKWEDCPEVFGPTGEKCRVEITAAKTVKAEFFSSGFNLGITNTGTGTGTVECEVNGGGAEPCALSYPGGTTVKLKAIASAGSEFKEYSGDCTGSTCELTMTADKSVQVKFDLEAGQKTLAINITGEGEVKCKVGVGSPGPCAASYPEGTQLALEPIAGPHATFVGWNGGTGSGSGCTGTGTCEFTITADSTVNAPFPLTQRTLTLNKSGTGNGSFECDSGSGFGACAASYVDGTTITIKAVPNGSSVFAGWSGGGCSGTGNCVISSISADTTVMGTFILAQRTLTLNKSGTGNGSFECDSGSGFGACAASYVDGTTITIKAVPNGSSVFAGWSGGGCSGTGNCVISNINANTTVTGTFNLDQRTLTINKAGTGNGSFECDSGSGFGACAASYATGTTITIKPVPNGSSVFAGWSGGGCSGTGNCVISSISADTTVTGTFILAQRTLALNKSGTGGGSFECTTGGPYGPCQASYTTGTTIIVKATPDSHSTFTSWSGCDSLPEPNKCAIEGIGANKTVTATFTVISRMLTVNKAGLGSGSIACDGGVCAANYNDDTVVTLTASADSHSTFAGWSGGGCSGTGACEVTLDADKTVTATFDKKAEESALPPLVQCVVPRLAGKTVAKAKSALADAHCALGKVIKPKPKKGRKRGLLVVRSSSPAAGASLPDGSEVDLRLGLKPKKEYHEKGKKH